ncbi:MAG: matrixin family metalloprotease [Chloroflexota bacterium]|nr:matrixin family metalloprotease [Chloroflexota bacterium]
MPLRRIVIQRLGRVRPQLLTGLRRSLRDLYGLTVSIAPTVRRLTPDAYSSSRDQYRADLLLRHVQENVADGEAVAAITEADIYEPGYNFLFGLSYIGEGASLVSTFRLDDDLPEAAEATTLASRVRKIATHELGHAIGLDHCRERGCVMRYSDHVAAVDRESDRFGPICRKRLAAALSYTSA